MPDSGGRIGAESSAAASEALFARVLNGTAKPADVDWLVETIETLTAERDEAFRDRDFAIRELRRYVEKHGPAPRSSIS